MNIEITFPACQVPHLKLRNGLVSIHISGLFIKFSFLQGFPGPVGGVANFTKQIFFGKIKQKNSIPGYSSAALDIHISEVQLK
jgi:hypothetical protein